MNPTHVHLMVTHLPIFGSMLAVLVLAYGLIAKSHQTQVAAFGMLVVSAVGAGIAYLTGEGAEESVEGLPGVLEGLIEQHEESALLALVGTLLTGLAALAGIVLHLRKSPALGRASLVVLLLGAVSFGLVARTGYLGGQIRHTEIRDAGSQAGGGNAQESGEDGDDD